ncbi:hypothetical protein [Clostridium amazonitimonense]|uniref:hypothetical protein n=1 Tax=Clostridium amazonitimonense TaxID=1499689 RepID=UPI000509C718|nr:hypothetical protein [Clostridium amazonitimonense]
MKEHLRKKLLVMTLITSIIGTAIVVTHGENPEPEIATLETNITTFGENPEPEIAMLNTTDGEPAEPEIAALETNLTMNS